MNSADTQPGSVVTATTQRLK